MPYEHLSAYLVMVGVVFVVNLIPAFGPPTWAVLVWFRLHDHLAMGALVLLGATAAACGRVVLALTFRRYRGHVSAKTRDNLEAAREVVQGNKARSWAGLALFTISPLPSAQLFEAAGLLALPLLWLTVAFTAGRLVSYTLYVAAASAAEDTSVGRLVTENLTSPIAFLIEVVMLGLLYALTRIDWRRHLHPAR